MAYKKTILVATSAALFALAFSQATLAMDPPKELTRIQREGNAYYRVDLKAANLSSRVSDYRIHNAWQVLPKNTPASCTNTVAIKVKKIVENTEYKPLVFVYQTKGSGIPLYHTVVAVLTPDSGWWVLGNSTNYVRYYKDLSAFKNLEVGTLEYFRERN